MISKEKKQAIIKELTDKLTRQKIVIFSDYTGLKVSQIDELRRKLREKGIDYLVAKKTLIDLALQRVGLDKIKVKELPGQIGLVIGYQDEALPAKILHNFAKENESLKMLAGLVRGEYLANQSLVDLAQLPSREELLIGLVSSLAAPLSGLLNTLRGNLRKLIFILKNVKS